VNEVYSESQEQLKENYYPQYYKIVQLALTLPVGSATAERSFSAMRRIRNWLRSTMGLERPNFSPHGTKPNYAHGAVTKTPKFHHITPILKSLNWLNINKRIKYKFVRRCGTVV